MLTRRHFIATAAGAGLSGALPARAIASEEPGPDYRAHFVRTAKGTTPYELHLHPDQFSLYWTLPDRKAIRYWVGVAKPGLYEAGTFYVGAKKEWPSWTPTPEMIERNPQYAEWVDGMPGGPANPLGARALYLFTASGRDTMLRIHGTNDPRTIGRAVSNGCARLTNGYIKHLYPQVPKGTRVVLHPRRYA